MDGELPDRDAAHVVRVLQLDHMAGDWVIERQLTLLDRLGQQRGFEQFAQRRDVEQRVRRDRTLMRHIGQAVVEERRAAAGPYGDCRAADAVRRQDVVDVLPDQTFDLGGIDLRVGGGAGDEQDEQDQPRQHDDSLRLRLRAATAQRFNSISWPA